MIKEIRKSLPQKYGKYFLSMEAPGDEAEEQPVVKSNTKVINVKPNNRKKIDFTDGADEVENDPTMDEPSEEQPEDDSNDVDTDTSQDFTQDNPDEPSEEQPVNPDTEPTVADGTDGGEANPDGTEQSPTDDPNANTEPTVADGTDADNVTINADTPVDNPDGPDVDTGGEDFAADDNADSGEANPDGTEQPPADDPNAAKKGPGLEYDSTRKYNLFENYMSLINALNNYITKLENNMGDDLDENRIIETVTRKLREIHDLTYDYMTMKFEISSYVQSLLFFQNLIIMVQMSFELLQKLKNVKNNNK